VAELSDPKPIDQKQHVSPSIGNSTGQIRAKRHSGCRAGETLFELRHQIPETAAHIIRVDHHRGRLLRPVTQTAAWLRLKYMITATGVMDNEQVYRSYAVELTRYATGLVGPFDAADVVTDACLKAFSSKKWPEVNNQRAYLYRAVLSVATDHHRSTLSRRLRELKTADPESMPPQEIDIDVLRAVERLSMQQRAVVLLTYWADLPVETVANQMGVSTGAVKRHLARARKHLKESLS
jgi:RNA polymerase sigma-70 factor (ECF subfamily)